MRTFLGCVPLRCRAHDTYHEQEFIRRSNAYPCDVAHATHYRQDYSTARDQMELLVKKLKKCGAFERSARTSQDIEVVSKSAAGLHSG